MHAGHRTRLARRFTGPQGAKDDRDHGFPFLRNDAGFGSPLTIGAQNPKRKEERCIKRLPRTDQSITFCDQLDNYNPLD
ncbi:hypothetical protein MACH23_28740 [Sulfitobacter pontiacus]|nr:hypothetical protein MACH23_28740 [Sulfitobacter pontiacus]